MRTRAAQQGDGARVFVLALDKGDEVTSTLLSFVQHENVRGGHLVALGAMSEVSFGFFDPDRRGYREFHIREQVEVASMVGTIAWDEQGPVVHTHLVVGLNDGRALGGHLLGGTSWPTLEVVVTEIAAQLDKRTDNETGLALLDL